jgi:hypothetical protein
MFFLCLIIKNINFLQNLIVFSILLPYSLGSLAAMPFLGELIETALNLINLLLFPRFQNYLK